MYIRSLQVQFPMKKLATFCIYKNVLQRDVLLEVNSFLDTGRANNINKSLQKQ